MAPTLIVHTEAGPLAATISGTTRLSLKKVKRALGLRNVALAPREAVVGLTRAEPRAGGPGHPRGATPVDPPPPPEPWGPRRGGGAPPPRPPRPRRRPRA